MNHKALASQFRQRALVFLDARGMRVWSASNAQLRSLLHTVFEVPFGVVRPRGRIAEYKFYIEALGVGTKKTTKSRRKEREEFYFSKEWRAVRYQALVKYGRGCQCCGRQPPEVVLHVDHIKPRSKYPELELELSNLQILCEDCNLGKSNKDNTDWRESSVACAETGSATVVNGSMNGMQSQS